MKKYGKWIAVALLLSLVFSAVAVNYHKNGAEKTESSFLDLHSKSGGQQK